MHAATPQFPRRLAKLGLVCLLAGGGLAKGAVQFDVFMGFAGKARQGEWFPVTFEIFNDGPTFDGQVELRPRFGDNPVYRYDVELATNTRKRFTLAVFADTNSGWSAKLKNGGKTVAKHDELRLNNSDPDTVLVGALSGQQAGGPVLPKTRFKSKWDNDRFAPRVAHLQLDTFPDDPIALSGLNALYLNSARAINLRTEQAAALSTWVLGGGHLILAVDQPGDVTSTPWLASLIRGRFGPVQNSAAGQALHRWAETGGYPDVASPDATFAAGQLATAEVRLAKGEALFELDNRPVAAEANRGLGQVSVLGFNPEREPFKSWTNRAWFWARLAKVPAAWFEKEAPQQYGRSSIDGVYGAMLDSRQVSKLPIVWLLLLLAAYLVIIGPVDRIWLKRINKQMLTWLTFPAYVAIFSLLIYFIGYKLRAGQLELNELHIVDVLPGQQEVLRGRSYVSIYSPLNDDYRLGGSFEQGGIRSEYGGTSQGNMASSLRVQRAPGKLEASARVPIWTSRLLCSEWLAPANGGVTAALTKNGRSSYELAIKNGLDKAITGAMLLAEGKVTELELQSPPRSTRTLRIQTAASPYAEDEFGSISRGGRFQRAVNTRNQAFGDTESGRIDPEIMNLVSCSFPALLKTGENKAGHRVADFTSPSGLDLSAHAERGGAVLFLLVEAHAPIPSTGLFETKLGQARTLYRIPLEITKPE
ncbi:MAG TPA: hypothetical protein EYM45_03020 [Verrucomicrobia bacterium]|nr:hypothetical protein [Verrucomicrobiota bacterium]